MSWLSFQQMRKFGDAGWEIELLPGWIGEHEDYCSIIYQSHGVGALQISAYSRDGEVTERDLKELASEYMEPGVEMLPAISGVFSGFTFSFTVENEFWQHWYVSYGNKALVITYGCELEDRAYELPQVKEMVANLLEA